METIKLLNEGLADSNRVWNGRHVERIDSELIAIGDYHASAGEAFRFTDDNNAMVDEVKYRVVLTSESMPILYTIAGVIHVGSVVANGSNYEYQGLPADKIPIFGKNSVLKICKHPENISLSGYVIPSISTTATGVIIAPADVLPPRCYDDYTFAANPAYACASYRGMTNYVDIEMDAYMLDLTVFAPYDFHMEVYKWQ